MSVLHHWLLGAWYPRD